MENKNLELFANTIRCLSIDMVNAANSGHQGAPLGFADVMSVLFNGAMNFNPGCENRDRFILSIGHASAMLYSSLFLSGKTSLTIGDLKSFRKIGSVCQGHPEINKDLGIEMTTGALGQGIATAVGFAIALKKKHIKSKVFVVVGDGDLMEGVSHEAMTLASKLNLDNLIVLFDDNDICIDGNASEFTTCNIERFKAYGFDIFKSDGHDYDQIKNTIAQAKSSNRPSFISFKTKIGKFTEKEGTNKCHGKFVSLEEAKAIRTKLGLPEEPFSIPTEFMKSNTTKQISKTDIDFTELRKVINEIKVGFINNPEEKSTRYFAGKVFEKLSEKFKWLIGGSADLSSSNCTISSNSKAITKESFEGNYIHYGVREHVMGCIMNGLAIEGFIPYGGTFLVFSDYMRPAIRNAALMGCSPIFVLTHDSIAVGEDGATHQPVEHINSLRLIPNLNVFRPSCDIEVAECIELAIMNRATPSAILLSRNNVKNIRITHFDDNLSSKGAYLLSDFLYNGNEQLTIFATGSEVSLAYELKESLESYDIRIVSAPCLEIFNKQPGSYKSDILWFRKLFIEAGNTDLLYKYKNRDDDKVIGISSFGESGTAKNLFEKFRIDAKSIIEDHFECDISKRDRINVYLK